MKAVKAKPVKVFCPKCGSDQIVEENMVSSTRFLSEDDWTKIETKSGVVLRNDGDSHTEEHFEAGEEPRDPAKPYDCQDCRGGLFAASELKVEVVA